MPNDHRNANSVAAAIAMELRLALNQLAQAWRYSAELACDRWEFAVELDRLLAVGLTTSDLRWLIKRGLVEHRRETTTADATHRTFAPPEKNMAFTPSTCFALTDQGVKGIEKEDIESDETDLPANTISFVSALESADEPSHQPARPSLASAGGSNIERSPADASEIELTQFEQRRHHTTAGFRSKPQSNVVPNWDRVARLLLVGETIVKRYRVPSPNQEALLDAFQEEGWPASIDDPLTPLPDQQPKRRLRDTIKCLNLNQATRLLRFRGDGTGQRVLWELLAGQLSVTSDAYVNEPRRKSRRAA